MEILRMEWKNIFKNKLLLMTCIAIAFIPLLYSSFFLKSVWDPYGNTENLPVAVVNEDVPVEFNGKSVDIGSSVVESLKNKKSMNWSFVDSKIAKIGLEKNDYYMVVTIPSDFSKNATSIMDESPKQMEINYVTNGSLNFIGRLMGQSATKELKSEVSRKVTSAYTNALVELFGEIGSNLEVASVGAEKLDSGTSEIVSGERKLKNGMDKLAQSTITFKDGANSFYEGISKYAQGISEANEGAEKLSIGAESLSNGLGMLESEVSAIPEGAKKLSIGSSELASGLSTAKSATSKLSDGVSELDSSLKALDTRLQSASGLEQLEPLLENLSQNPELFTSLSREEQQTVLKGSYSAVSSLDEIKRVVPSLSSGVSSASLGIASLNSNMTSLSSGAKSLSDGTAELEKSIPQLLSGVKALKYGSDELLSGSKALSNGTEKLDSKTSELKSGSNKILDGAVQLQSGSAELSNGSNSLDSALLELKFGTGELSEKLKDGSSNLSSLKLNDKTISQISAPTNMSEQEYSHVQNYGHALAPYVMSLALFIGCLVFNSIFPIREISESAFTSSSWYLGRFGIGLTIAIFMAFIEGSLMIALGLEVNSNFKFFSILVLTAICYMSIVMTLSMALDNPGRFLSMLLLIVQLGGSGGTFPIELTNSFFQTIHPYLPMSYSIYGLREAITGGLGIKSFYTSVEILLGIFIVFATLLFFVMKKLFKRSSPEIKTTIA